MQRVSLTVSFPHLQQYIWDQKKEQDREVYEVLKKIYQELVRVEGGVK
jgi:hypothetical protein